MGFQAKNLQGRTDLQCRVFQRPAFSVTESKIKCTNTNRKERERKKKEEERERKEGRLPQPTLLISDPMF